MNKQEYQQYCRSAHWHEVKAFVLERDEGRCVLCNRKAIQVHHRSYTHLEDFEAEARDCVALCKRCHKLFHDHVNIKQPSLDMRDLVYDPQTGGYWRK